MPKPPSKPPPKKTVVTLRHDEASRKNIPTAEYESVMAKELQTPIRVAYERRNRDLDPQLVWRGKDQQDWSDLVVQAPPLFIQEKVQPKVLIDDLMRRANAERLAREVLEREKKGVLGPQIDLFADFNGLPDTDAKTEFYQHDQHWANRLILGDSLQVMASLAEREGLRGKVQCIYLDPPYGIKFNSNFQWSTTSRDVKDGSVDHMTREPEQVKAFRDTWRDGIHSYLTYLRDRLTAARDLLTESGSIFVQIGDENVHRVRAVMDEVFLPENFVSQINVLKTATPTASLDDNFYYVIWFAKSKEHVKVRSLLLDKPMASWVSETRGGSWGLKFSPVDYRPLTPAERDEPKTIPAGDVYALSKTNSAGPASADRPFIFRGKSYSAGANAHWKTTAEGMERLVKADRLETRGGPPWMRKFHLDSAFQRMTNAWLDTSGKSSERWYVVQTDTPVIRRCLLMTTDPGDLVLDPTCGSGTTAYVAEQWGRRWITIDTSRVALALARARIMGARYPYYILADSEEGREKNSELRIVNSEINAGNSSSIHHSPFTIHHSPSLRQGFVYERVPHITLKSIANNAEIDVIWEKFQARLEPLREALNRLLKKTWEEWEIPRAADDQWSRDAREIHAKWWEQRIARQKEIDASIAAKAEFEYLYDKPYEDKKKVRVAGPFTVESLSPHRVLGVGPDDELIDPLKQAAREGDTQDFATMILDHLRTAGVQQAHKDDKIVFSSVTGWPGRYICAVGIYEEGGEKNSELGIVNSELGTRKAEGSPLIHNSPFTIHHSAAASAARRAAIFIGPEFGTVARQDLVAAAREAGDANFDVLIACAFNYEAMASEFNKLGRIPVLKARMNAELHMGTELKNTGKGNLFVIFGEPDIDILHEDGQIRAKINGVDVFHPNTGEVRSDGADGIACWFIDTDYNGESFFVRQAYFLGANDPYKALKTTLRSEINEEAWASLNSDTSRPFPKPAGGRIAVKVINHLGDEVMKVFEVE